MHVHAPWALAVNARIRERLGVEGSAVASDDGIIARVPDAESEPPGAELFVFEPDELEQLVTDEVGGSALFASRFRECAARALLLPRLNPNKRSPLWQQRQKSAQLLEVAKNHPTFPIILETLREVLQDVYDLLRCCASPAPSATAASVWSRPPRAAVAVRPRPAVRLRRRVHVRGRLALAERRAAALSVDPALLGELLGKVEMRELLDPAVIAQFEREAQRLDPSRRVRGLEGVADLLRLLGPLDAAEVAARLAETATPTQDASAGAAHTATATAAPPRRMPRPTRPHGAASAFLDQLVAARRAIRVSVGGVERVAAIEDAGRLRDALGAALPVGIPLAFLEPVVDPLADLIARHARTHGPFRTADVARRLGIGAAVARQTLQRLESQGRVASGFFLPEGRPRDRFPATRAAPAPASMTWNGATARCCDVCACAPRRDPRHRRTGGAGLLRALPPGVAAHRRGGRRTSARRRRRCARRHRAARGRAPSGERLGVADPAPAGERLHPAMLDELTSTGDVVWSGHGSLPGRDGWIALHPADTVTSPSSRPKTRRSPPRRSSASSTRSAPVARSSPVSWRR
jgi:ATP-dependent Lhr-like helicase